MVSCELFMQSNNCGGRISFHPETMHHESPCLHPELASLFQPLSQRGPFLSLCNNGTGCGTLFKITPCGKLTTLYDFCSKTDCTDGDRPLSPLIQARNGDLYGSAPYGGENGGGTVFQLTVEDEFTTLHNFAYTDGSEPVSALLQAADGSLYGTTLTGGSSGWGTVLRISKK